MTELSSGDCTTLDVIGTLWVTRIIKFTVLAIVIELFRLPKSFFTNIMQNGQMPSTTYVAAVSGNTTFTTMRTAAAAKTKLVYSKKKSKFRSLWPVLETHTVANYVLYYKIGRIYPPGRATIR